MSSRAAVALFNSLVRGVWIGALLGSDFSIALADEASHPAAIVDHRQGIGAARPIWSHAIPAASDVSLVSDGTQVILWPGPGFERYSGLESYALDGHVRWRVAGDLGPPLAVGNGKVYGINGAAQTLIGLDPDNGRIVWHSRRIAKLDVYPQPGARILVNGHGLALFGPGLVFVDLATGRVRAAEQEGLGLILTPDAVEAARLVGTNLFVTISYDGAILSTAVAQYDITIGKIDWESPNDASRFWVFDHTLLVADDARGIPTGPFYTHTPVDLEARGIGGYASTLPWRQATFSPDPPAKLQLAYMRLLTPAYVAWPYLAIVANARLYRYDLRVAPTVQSPDRLGSDDPIVGALSNGTLVIGSKRALEFVSFGSKLIHVAHVTRTVLNDSAPFPTFTPLGDAAVLSDAAGTALIFHDGKRVADITASCRTLITATAVDARTIAVVCKNGPHQVLELFRAPT